MSIHPPNGRGFAIDDAVAEIIDAYLGRNNPESDDPIDDGVRILSLFTGGDAAEKSA